VFVDDYAVALHPCIVRARTLDGREQSDERQLTEIHAKATPMKSVIAGVLFSTLALAAGCSSTDAGPGDAATDIDAGDDGTAPSPDADVDASDAGDDASPRAGGSPPPAPWEPHARELSTARAARAVRMCATRSPLPME